MARLGHPEHTSGQLHWQALAGHHRDGLEPPFWGTTLPSSSLARRWIANSVSNSAIRRFAAVSSALLRTAQAGLEALVDPVLPAAGLDRLRTDLQIPRYLDHRPASRYHIQHPAPELRRIPTPAHTALLEGSGGQDSSYPTPENPGHTSLRTRRGGSSRPRRRCGA